MVVISTTVVVERVASDALDLGSNGVAVEGGRVAVYFKEVEFGDGGHGDSMVW